MIRFSNSSEPEKPKGKSPKKPNLPDDKAPELRIVIQTSPTGTGFQSDDGSGPVDHDDKSALLDHLSSTLPGEDSEDDASADSDAPSDGSASTIQSLLRK